MTALTSLIVGPGAIGSIVCLHAQRYSSVYVHQHKNNLALAPTIYSGNQPRSLMWKPYNGAGEVNVVWVCCKANQVMSVMPALGGQHPNATIILLHNGMGPQQQLSELFPGRCLWGFTTCGAIKLDNGHFQQTSYGNTPIAMPKLKSATDVSLIEHLTNKKSDDPLATELVDNIEDQLWVKIIINAAINYVTAYYQIPNGDLLKPKYGAEIEQITSEANSVRHAAGFEPIDNIVDVVRDIAQTSMTNRSSMAEDIRCVRMTENEFIIGYLLDRATKSQIPTPTLKIWHKRIVELEQRNRTI